MQFQAPTFQTVLEQMVDQILVSQKITSAEKHELTDILASYHYQPDALSEEQLAKVQRVFYGLRHGLITLIE